MARASTAASTAAVASTAAAGPSMEPITPRVLPSCRGMAAAASTAARPTGMASHMVARQTMMALPCTASRGNATTATITSGGAVWRRPLRSGLRVC
eukprot:4915556-Prymnesium_polylepis.1